MSATQVHVANGAAKELTDLLATSKISPSESREAAPAPTNGQVNRNGHDHTNGDAAADDDDDDDEGEADVAAASTGAKKKKKNKSGAAKKKAKAAAAARASAAQNQSEPPRIGLTTLFPNGQYPVGEIQQYDTSKFLDENRARTTAEELRERERIQQEEEGCDYNLIRRAAETHRQVRAYARKAIQPGMSMTDIANLIEDGTRAVVEANGFDSGIGFPTGLSLNECAAHFTPNAGDKRILQKSDVLKVDIGVHVAGRICDSAFTLTWEDTHNPLLEIVREATNTGVRESGIDARLGEIGAAIQEVMESGSYEVNGEMLNVKCVRNLQGHNIERYSIHGGKSVPIVAQPDLKTRMEEGEYFAIETFGTTGRGYVQDQGDCSHYAKRKNAPGSAASLRVQSARTLLYTINKNFGTLPFCRRYLDRLGEKAYLLGLKHLVDQGIVQDYPPLCDVPGSMTAQFEHTILLRPTCKEVVSRGDDY
ncbi:peptidase M24A, methionine aminopeptidase [Tilletiaria anomala UBC 951]|uniref:Methionine aminopeptidase 2 n=1 Tax=Tilletiaria anomala (strain ATCC 24038 / CBS 436.72 / UBC 951) TaxID=1037660 RepID=A0A066VXN5_TILAU|nr:peptidase M24A, methionine aminopeptidase [Tilletiaria anomala UBC 951]KDN46472.1 peptidase M24A, methionine aminopeptidase [Tilletiaria anomala UBC 951]